MSLSLCGVAASHPNVARAIRVSRGRDGNAAVANTLMPINRSEPHEQVDVDLPEFYGDVFQGLRHGHGWLWMSRPRNVARGSQGGTCGVWACPGEEKSGLSMSAATVES